MAAEVVLELCFGAGTQMGSGGVGCMGMSKRRKNGSATKLGLAPSA
jgi:hypothetical protein